MAEWAGPASEGGRLLIQTSEPSHHGLQALVRADHDYFVARELEHRRELGYPPFNELVKVTAFGPARAELLDAVRKIGLDADGVVLGPIHPGARQPTDAAQLLIKCPDARAVADGLRVILPSVPTGNRLSVDVDPR
jgi:primosomal protein N' (replication factor Y)